MKRPRLSILAALLVAALLTIDVLSRSYGFWCICYQLTFGVQPHSTLLALGPIKGHPVGWGLQKWGPGMKRDLPWWPNRIQDSFLGDGVVVPIWNITIFAVVLFLSYAAWNEDRARDAAKLAITT